MCLIGALLLIRNLYMMQEVHDAYTHKYFGAGFLLFLRCAIPEIEKHGRAYLTALFFNYMRQLVPFVAKQLLYFGRMRDWDEFLVYLVLVPIVTYGF
jgi:hypothetical protein